MADEALWWSSRDVLAEDGSVVIQRQHPATLAEFKAAFTANPGKYPGEIHTLNGLKTYVGSSGAQAGWDDFVGYVDGIRVATATSDTLWDFTQGVGPCVATVDATTQTYTLTEDCDTFSTVNVPNGWTIDGTGHSLTAHEDVTRPNFQGPIISSATGDDSGPAELHLANLEITTDFSGQNSGGTLVGVKYDRAGGSVSNVSIDGVTHGNGVQEGHALWVRNRDAAGSTAVPRAELTVDDLTVTDYQKSGVIFDGNLEFTMSNSFVGSNGDIDGEPIVNTASNSIQVSRKAQGSITDSEIHLNEYDNESGDGSAATAVLVYNAKGVELARNVITGGDGDVAVYAFNDTFDVDTVLTATCNLISRNLSDGDYDPFGVALNADEQPNITARSVDNTFRGWTTDVAGFENEIGQGECPPNAATDVAVEGGRGTAEVSWAHGEELRYAPRTGYTVTLTDGDKLTKTHSGLPADTTSVEFRGIPAKRDYTVIVSTEKVSGSMDATTTLHHTTLTIDQTDKQVVYGQRSGIEGVLASSDPSATLGGRTLTLEARALDGGAWTDAAQTQTEVDGSYSFNVRPDENTRYRVRHDGGPELGVSSGPRNVYVAAKMTLRVSDKTVRPGSTVLFYGAVSPDHDGNRVLLQRRVDGDWKTFRSADLSGRSTYAFRWEPRGKRDLVWQVAMRGDAEHVAGSSRNIEVTVL
jgi:hypothetical protein